jgi:hypothetical protein
MSPELSAFLRRRNRTYFMFLPNYQMAKFCTLGRIEPLHYKSAYRRKPLWRHLK